MTQPGPSPISDQIMANGGLYDIGWYLSWEVGEKTATLDGKFTAEDLEAIAAHMREFSNPK